MQQRSEQFLSIQQGMTEQEVRAKLGPPDEVRLVDPEYLLDGVRVSSAEKQTPETHRWAYGAMQPGGFARGGVVSFDAAGTVVGARCPPRGMLGGWTVKPERVRASSRNLSVKVEQVRLEEARGQSPRCWWVQITATNHGTAAFSRKCFWRFFDRQVAVEIYDHEGILYREDLSQVQNGALSMDATFMLPGGASKTEEIAVMPDEYFGLLPPGTYYLKAYLAEGAEFFVASKPFKVIVGKPAQASDKTVTLMPNKITRANAGGPSLSPIRTHWAARIAQFCR